MSERYVSSLPKYNWYDYKAGRCSDLDYYKSAYGGSGSTVTKHFDPKDTKKDHPFFVIKRNVRVNFWGEKVAEFKVYDMSRGLLNKEEHTDVTNSVYWKEYKKSFPHMNYVDFLADTFAIIPPDPKKDPKKEAKRLAKANERAKKSQAKKRALAKLAKSSKK